MSNLAQQEFWNTQAGAQWVNQQEAMDATLRPVLDLVMQTADLQDGESVLDIGCGTGASVVEAARAVGPEGRVTGLDIAATLLARAKARTEGQSNVTLLRADAATADLPIQHDVLISRFGVMFFADTTAAFAKIRQALKPGARLIMAAWGPAPENPWFMEAAAAARAHFGPMPKTDRSQPGPFAWEDSRIVADALSKAGLRDVEIKRVPLHLTPRGGPAGAARVSTHIGPAHSALRHFDGTETDRAAVQSLVRDRFAAFDSDRGLRIPALIHLVTAHS